MRLAASRTASVPDTQLFATVTADASRGIPIFTEMTRAMFGAFALWLISPATTPSTSVLETPVLLKISSATMLPYIGLLLFDRTTL